MGTAKACKGQEGQRESKEEEDEGRAERTVDLDGRSEVLVPHLLEDRPLELVEVLRSVEILRKRKKKA